MAHNVEPIDNGWISGVDALSDIGLDRKCD